MRGNKEAEGETGEDEDEDETVEKGSWGMCLVEGVLLEEEGGEEEEGKEEEVEEKDEVVEEEEEEEVAVVLGCVPDVPSPASLSVGDSRGAINRCDAPEP